MFLDGITDEHERKEVSNMANTTDPILHVEIVQGVSKAGKPYECLEVLLGEGLRWPSLPNSTGNALYQSRSAR
jgi:hypothetical protein